MTSPTSVFAVWTVREAAITQTSFVILVVIPFTLIAVQLRAIHQTRSRVAERNHRYSTYLMLEEAVRTIRSEMPISQALILSGDVVNPRKSQRLYQASPTDGKRWEDKVMITDLLELLDRLARGVRMGVIDVAVWQAMSGYNVSRLCESLRHFIKVSQEFRADRYAALMEVDQVFIQMSNEESLALLEAAEHTNHHGRAR